ncbi:MAG: DUF6000 family protein [Bacteroidota bacterium]
MLNKEELDFHPEFVAPYYGDLMNMNFARSEIMDNPHEFLLEVRSLKNKLSSEDILILLNGNWRPSKVGAWIIGLGKMYELEDALEEYLKTKWIYLEHVICSLSILNTPTVVPKIQDFIENKFSEINQRESPIRALQLLERSSVDWAFAALKYLDKKNGTNNYQQSLKGEGWIEMGKVLWQLKKKEGMISELAEDFLKVPERVLIFDKGMDIVAEI